MDKIYKNSEWLILAFILLIIWGFSKPYFLLFPQFEGVMNAEHYHFALMAIWCVILFTQPLLIKYKKLNLHRIIGKFTFLLIPLLLHSIFLVVKASYYSKLTELPQSQLFARLAVQLPDIVTFGFFYVLAIVYRKNTKYHLRFMLATAFLMFGPAIFRVFRDSFGIVPAVSSEYTFIASDILCVGFLLYDFYKKQPIKPFLIVLIALLVEHFIFEMRMTFVWQSFADKFVAIFF
jgi:hypothetical protein